MLPKLGNQRMRHNLTHRPRRRQRLTSERILKPNDQISLSTRRAKNLKLVRAKRVRLDRLRPKARASLTETGRDS
ncbi:hypothetical protein ACLQ21_15515 [Agrococcus sp. DT81.2]